MTDVQQAVPVAQEDLELAESIVSRTRGFGVKLGKTDSRAIDIARHRLAALTPDATQTREAEGPTDTTMRAALQDIADAEAIPNDAVAFVWCREVARAALNARDAA